MTLALCLVLIFLVTIFVSHLYFENRRYRKLLLANKDFYNNLRESGVPLLNSVANLTKGYSEIILENYDNIETGLDRQQLKGSDESIDDLLEYLDAFVVAVDIAHSRHKNIA